MENTEIIEAIGTTETQEAALAAYPEKIRTYLDNVFAALPANEAAQQLKTDMYDSMTDKFHALAQEGATPDEAFGRVVGEFGSLGEIRAALGLTESSAAPEVPVVSPERQREYRRFQMQRGIVIAVGVLFCVAAVFGYPWYENLTYAEEAHAVFGTLAAIGVFLFVFAGVSGARFVDITEPEKLLPEKTPERWADYQKFLRLRAWLIALAVGLFVVAPFMSEGQYFFMPFFIAVGVAILIVVGAVHNTFNDVKKY